MTELRHDVVINRALLTNPALDSGAIAVRGTVFHVFTEAGDHDVTILRDGRVTGRFTVAVQPEGAVPQVNVDLAGQSIVLLAETPARFLVAPEGF
jgi:hypothetical protein